MIYKNINHLKHGFSRSATHIFVANAEFQKLRYTPRKDKSITLYKPVIRLYSPDIRLHNSSVSVKKWTHIRQYHLNHCKQRLLRTSVVNKITILSTCTNHNTECMCLIKFAGSNPRLLCQYCTSCLLSPGESQGWKFWLRFNWYRPIF